MPKNKMPIMPIDEQIALQEQLGARKLVREANDLLFTIALTWITDSPMTREEFYQAFNAGGHFGEYRQYPLDDAKRRIKAIQQKLSELRLRAKETPLDFMGATELSYVYQRIQLMLQKIDEYPSGTMDEAIQLYTEAGAIIRQRVYDETKHYPEEFPLPQYGRITGKENIEQYQIRPYQPPLLGE